MAVSLGRLAELVGGAVEGDPALAVECARPLTDARAGDLTLVDGDKYLAAWHASPASAAVAPARVRANGRPVIHVADPILAFAQVIVHLRGGPPKPQAARIDPGASVHPTATLGEGVSVGPFASVGANSVVGPGTRLMAGAAVGADCRLGANCVLHPHAVLYDRTVLGDNVVIHANSVIGADGFGYRLQGGRHAKIPQLGGVEVGDGVEIGACSTIDAGTFSPTTIGEGTKIDNLVHIAHNCKIGRHNLIVGQVGISGSCVTGDYVVMAGQVGLGDHITVGDRAMIGAKAGVMKDIPADAKMLGIPATPHREQLKILHSFTKLPQLSKDVRRVLRHLGLDPGAGGAEKGGES